MPRWAKAVGWLAMLWTVALVAIATVLGAGDSCDAVRPSDLHLCELDRDSAISGLLLVWFLGVLPMALIWLFARLRRVRCRICGEELGAAERRVCRRCGARLIETAAR